ncbi:unnamed protein product, partial [Hymenolepis diminuta]
MNWEMFRTPRPFYVTTDTKGCPGLAWESAKSEMEAPSEWRNASIDDEIRTAHPSAFRDMVSLSGIQDTHGVITEFFVEGMDIPVEWREWLAEGRKTARKQPIASSLKTSSTEAKGHCSESHERLTTFVSIENATQVWILNRECSAVEIELQLRGRKCTTVFTFQDKLVFMGGWQSENVTGSRNVDLMDISTGQVSSIPDMIKARNSPVGVATENEIFAICNRWPSDSPSRF